MRSWGYGVNSLYKKASIYLEEASWWVFVVNKIVEFLCDFTPSIPLPKIKMRLKNREDIEFNGGSELTTLRDWYGDSRQVFHCFVHMPVFDFCIPSHHQTDSHLRSLLFWPFQKVIDGQLMTREIEEIMGREITLEEWNNLGKS